MTVATFVRNKVRFGLSKLPYVPVRYRLASPPRDLPIWWSRVMPFLDPARGLWTFELYGWDVRELQFLRRYLRPGMTFIDIGAYHGLYAVVAGLTMGGEGRIVAFEPTPHDRRRLQLHLRLNGIKNARVEPYAVSDASGSARFFVPTSGVKTIASLRPSNLATRGLATLDVPTITLDAYCEGARIASIDVIKVDVEGAELALLRGATVALDRRRPLWIIEVIDDVAAAWGYRARDILIALRAHGYELFGFTPGGGLERHAVAERYPLQSNANVLAVPTERAEDVARDARL